MDNYQKTLTQYKNVELANLFKLENKFNEKVLSKSKKYTETMNSIRGFDITDYVPELKKLFHH